MSRKGIRLFLICFILCVSASMFNTLVSCTRQEQQNKTNQKRIEKSRQKDVVDKVRSCAVEPLIQALNDKHLKVCEAAALALGALGDKRAVEPLIAALHDKDSDVRETAARALGKLGDKRAVEQLIQALHDEDWRVRSLAAAILGTLGAK